MVADENTKIKHKRRVLWGSQGKPQGKLQKMKQRTHWRNKGSHKMRTRRQQSHGTQGRRRLKKNSERRAQPSVPKLANGSGKMRLEHWFCGLVNESVQTSKEQFQWHSRYKSQAGEESYPTYPMNWDEIEKGDTVAVGEKSGVKCDFCFKTREVKACFFYCAREGRECNREIIARYGYV